MMVILVVIIFIRVLSLSSVFLSAIFGDSRVPSMFRTQGLAGSTTISIFHDNFEALFDYYFVAMF